MTAELIGVLSVGVALGALIVAGLAAMRADLREMRRELTALARRRHERKVCWRACATR